MLYRIILSLFALNFAVFASAQGIRITKGDDIVVALSADDVDCIEFTPASEMSAFCGDSIRILAIGNSFAQDAVGDNLNDTIRTYLYDMLHEAGIEAVVGCIPLPSASLKDHLSNAQASKAVYPFYYTNSEGFHTYHRKVTIREALKKYNWTHVSIQQASEFSGDFDSYAESLPELVEYIRGFVCENTKVMLHQTWAYAQDCSKDAFGRYDNDQATMYEAICDASSRAMQEFDLDMVVPVGTAIQNARTSPIGDRLTRDGVHLDLGVGRFVAASTWFQALIGNSALGNAYKPEGIGITLKYIVGMAAATAVVNPYAVTKL